MKKFLIIYHIYWMGDGYFKREIVERESEESALEYGLSKCHKNEKVGEHWDCCVVDLERMGRRNEE
ncbi:MAG: hypothetical protein ACOCRK_07960 [bacterium]